MTTEPLHSATAATITATAGNAWLRGQRRADGERDDALPTGTRLHEFEVLGVLGAGGFGIVYLALDHTLRRTVAVKEYLPVDFARRTDKWTVAPRTASDASTFAAGLQSFMKEAQLLAGFDHPSLVKVHRFWKANGTAYMVMPHYPGRTLKEMQRTTGGLRDEQSLRRLLHPLLCVLEVLHEGKIYHRDISPDNVMVLPDGKPVLLDFGSARHVFNDRTQALTAMFKPSFAAIEQYGDVPGLKQGAWTDLYALAGVMHFMITGSPPVPAALRAVSDAQPRLAAITAGKVGLSMSLLQALDWALAVRPDERPQSVQAFRDVLDGVAAAPRAGPDLASSAARPQPVPTTTAVALTAAPSLPQGNAMQGRRLRGALALLAASAVLGLAFWSRQEAATADPPPAPIAARSAAGLAPVKAERTSARPPAALTAVAVEALTVEVPTVAPKLAPPRRDARTFVPATRASAPAPRLAGARDLGPRELCGDRNFLSMATCMDRQCQDPAFRAHAQCESARRYAEGRRQSEMSP